MLSVTNCIVIVTCLISFLAFRFSRVKKALIFWPPAIDMKHEYYRFFTHGLIHANGMHLVFNMITLFFFGRFLDVIYRGELGLQYYYYPILYVSAIVVASIPSYIKHKEDFNYYSLGASGAVCAVMFANMFVLPWYQVWLYGAIPMPSIVFAALFLGATVYMNNKRFENMHPDAPKINHDAHLWGALYGVVFTIAVRPSSFKHFLNEMMHPRFF